MTTLCCHMGEPHGCSPRSRCLGRKSKHGFPMMLLMSSVPPDLLGYGITHFPSWLRLRLIFCNLAARGILVDTDTSFLHPRTVNSSLLLTLPEIPCLGLSLCKSAFFSHLPAAYGNLCFCLPSPLSSTGPGPPSVLRAVEYQYVLVEFEFLGWDFKFSDYPWASEKSLKADQRPEGEDGLIKAGTTGPGWRWWGRKCLEGGAKKNPSHSLSSVFY